MLPLPEKVQKRLRMILDFYREYKRMPSYQELVRLFRIRSKNAAYKIAGHMVSAGLLRRDATGRLIPSPQWSGVPVLGVVEAGFPSPAEEEHTDTMSLDEYLITNREATYMLKVKGNSMIEAGIMPGDLVLAERRGSAKDGDIVIAEVDGEWTMKIFRARGRATFLEAANKTYKPIFPKQSLKISAVVRAVVRKY